MQPKTRCARCIFTRCPCDGGAANDNVARRIVVIPDDTALIKAPFLHRLAIVVVNSGFARRPLVEDIATTYMNFTGRLQFADGREFDLIDMPDDDCFSPNGDATWVRDFINAYINEAAATDTDPMFIPRYRRLSTYFFIAHPNLARHLRA